MTSAPKPRVAATLICGVASGMTICARMPQRRGVEGDALRVVAGAGRDHAALPLRLAEREQLVQRAALLEGARALQVLQLQVQRQAGQLGEVAGELAGREVDGLADARAGCLDAGKGNGFQ